MAFLGDSVADEILQAIARRSTIKAIGRTSSFQFRGADKVVARITQELGATHVLDGSVRKAGDTLRISAHLMNVSDHAMVWSDRFDGRLDDIFALQDEVAGATVAALNGVFDKGGRPRETRSETLALIARMRGFTGYAVNPDERAYWSDFEPRERTAGTDPEALGHLAMVYASARWTADAVSEPALRLRARSLAQRALEQDPGNGAAHKAMFLLEPSIGAFAHVEHRLLQARKAAPHDGEIAWSLYYHYLSVGRTGASFAAAEEAYRVDPLRPPNALGYANALYTAGRGGEAVSLMRHILDRWPNDPLVYAVTIWSATSEGEDDLVERLLSSDGRARFGAEAQRMIDAAFVAVEALRSPRERACRSAMERLQRAIAAKRSPFGLIGLCARLGADFDELYDLVEQCDLGALHQAAAPMTPLDGLIHLFLRVNARLRESPRFVTLCQRLGLVDYWLASGHWPDCLSEVAPHYDFAATALSAQ
jgi:TolB-like protein